MLASRSKVAFLIFVANFLLAATINGGNPTETNFALQVGNVNFTVNGSQTFQVVDGSGVNINVESWKGGQLRTAIDMLANPNRATLWRVIRDPIDWVKSESLIPLLHRMDRATLQEVYEDPKMQDIWKTIAYLNEKGVTGNQIILNFMGWTPRWLGGSGRYNAESHVTAGKEHDLATMIASLVYYGRKVKNLNFTLVAPLNEMDWNCLEGPCVSPEQYAAIVHDLISELDVMGLNNIRIVGPDTANPGNLSYIDAMMGDRSIAARVDHLSYHNYGGSLQPQRSYPSANSWLTETAASCNDCDYAGTPAQGEWTFASQTNKAILEDLEKGFAGVLVYDGFDSFYYHHNSYSYWGLLAYDPASGRYRPRKRFYVNAQINAFVSPGAVRIGEDDSIDALGTTVAFYKSATNELTIIGHTEGSAVTVTGQLLGLPEFSSFAIYETNSSVDFQRGPDVPVSRAKFTLTIPADTFFSLTNKK
jgi:O-glycosyl hydrolase